MPKQVTMWGDDDTAQAAQAEGGNATPQAVSAAAAHMNDVMSRWYAGAIPRHVPPPPFEYEGIWEAGLGLVWVKPSGMAWVAVPEDDPMAIQQKSQFRAHPAKISAYLALLRM